NKNDVPSISESDSKVREDLELILGNNFKRTDNSEKKLNQNDSQTFDEVNFEIKLSELKNLLGSEGCCVLLRYIFSIVKGLNIDDNSFNDSLAEYSECAFNLLSQICSEFNCTIDNESKRITAKNIENCKYLDEKIEVLE
ncbi:MAG: hypothetical protein MHPSP_004169, partial [Paramarteilia canceri]